MKINSFLQVLQFGNSQGFFEKVHRVHHAAGKAKRTTVLIDPHERSIIRTIEINDSQV